MSQSSFLQTGTTFVNGNTYQASDLNNAVNNATLQSSFIQQWSAKSVLSSTDKFILNDASGNFWNTTAANIASYFQNQSVLYAGIDSGTVGGKYVLTPSPALPSYATGQIILWKPSYTNSGLGTSTATATVNISGLGAVAIQIGGYALSGGELIANATVAMMYDGQYFQLINAPPNAINAINTQTFGSSGTYTPTAGMQYAKFELVGGGGGGGGCVASSSQCAAGGGGGGGGYLVATLPASSVGTACLITIGSAGTGGAIGGANYGSTGGSTTVIYNAGTLSAGTWTVGGGGGGAGIGGSTGGIALPGAGGADYSEGSLSALGQPGQAGIVVTSSQAVSGGGGGSFYGGGGAAVYVGNNGNNAIGYGAGGGGGATSASSGKSGGNGASGVVLITEYRTTS